MCGTVSRKLKRQSHPKIAGAHTVTPSHRFHAIRAAYAICLNSSGRNANPNTRSAAIIMYPSLLNSPRVSPLILPLIADMLSLFILFFLFIISIRSMLFILIAHIYICSSKYINVHHSTPHTTRMFPLHEKTVGISSGNKGVALMSEYLNAGTPESHNIYPNRCKRKIALLIPYIPVSAKTPKQLSKNMPMQYIRRNSVRLCHRDRK